MSNLDLNISLAAKNHFLNVIRDKKRHALRIGLKKIGCSGWQFSVDAGCQEKDDICWEDGDLTVVISKQYVRKIHGTSIDYVEKELGQKKLLIHCPNAQMHCGCGESFSFKDEA